MDRLFSQLIVISLLALFIITICLTLFYFLYKKLPYKTIRNVKVAFSELEKGNAYFVFLHISFKVLDRMKEQSFTLTGKINNKDRVNVKAKSLSDYYNGSNVKFYYVPFTSLGLLETPNSYPYKWVYMILAILVLILLISFSIYF